MVTQNGPKAARSWRSWKGVAIFREFLFFTPSCLEGRPPPENGVLLVWWTNSMMIHDYCRIQPVEMHVTQENQKIVFLGFLGFWSTKHLKSNINAIGWISGNMFRPKGIFVSIYHCSTM